MTKILNTKAAPKDPLKRLHWLTGVKDAVHDELETELQAALYQARLEGRFEAAVSAAGIGRKRALALTRAENDRLGRPIRDWGDGLSRVQERH